MVCHNYRRIPAIALAKQMIERGELGDRIYHFRARMRRIGSPIPIFRSSGACRRSMPAPARTATSTRTSLIWRGIS
jgi:hypothetical protein